MPTKNVELTKQQIDYINRRVDNGEFRDASAAIRAAVRLLKLQDEEYKKKLKRLREMADAGFAQIDRGEYEVMTEQRFAEFLDEVDQRIRKSVAK